MPNFCRTAQLGSTGTNTDLQSVLNTQKNQATKTNTCHIFLPKKARNVKVQTQKLLSHPCQLKSGLPPPPPPPPPPLRWTPRYTLLYSCSNLAAISCRCLLVRAPRIAIIASSSLPVIDRKRKKQPNTIL